MVPRPRLTAVLDRAAPTAVTVVHATAGAGKTSLLAGWAAGHRTHTAWVSLDEDDRDDRRFWSAVLASLAATPVVPEHSPLGHLAVPASPSTDPAFLAEVVNAVADLAEPVRVVLDDVHEIAAAGPVRGLGALLHRRPDNLRLVLSTRHGLPLPLGRLRLVGGLAELRTDDLRFSHPEAEALLAAAGVQLTPAGLAVLVTRTEGWAAVLRLAARSLAEANDPDGLVAEVTSQDPAVAAYLADEVLGRLPAATRHLLRAISLVDEVDADLAAHLTGREDGAAVLDHLGAHTALVTRTGGAGTAFRQHPLVREHLLAAFRRARPDQLAALHGQAADWFAGHDQPARALGHAVHARDTGRVTALVRRHSTALALTGEHDALRSAGDLLTEAQVAQDSELALVAAWLRLDDGDVAAAARAMALADTAWPPAPPDRVRTLRAVVRFRHAQVLGDHEALTRAVDPGAADRTPLTAVVELQRGVALLAAGDRSAARARLESALATARADANDYLAIHCLVPLARIAAGDGDLPTMTALAATADRTVQRGGVGLLESVTTETLLAYGSLLRADPARCLHHVERAEARMSRACPSSPAPARLTVQTLRGAAEFALGDRVTGAERMAGACRSTAATRHPRDQVALCAWLASRAANALGWRDTVRDVLRWAEPAIAGSGEVLVLRAAVTPWPEHAASELLGPVLDGSAPAVLPWTVVDAWLLAAELARRDGRTAAARQALHQALAHADRLAAPYPVVFPPDRCAGSVPAARDALDGPPRHVPLTPREHELLLLLPTLRSLAEIADDLMVSTNTVKTHLRAVYAKLGVGRRRDAVAVARERGLLGRQTSSRKAAHCA